MVHNRFIDANGKTYYGSGKTKAQPKKDDGKDKLVLTSTEIVLIKMQIEAQKTNG